MGHLLILTATELESRALARHLELTDQARQHPFPVHGRGGVRLAPVGIAASRLGARLDPLLDGLRAPLIVSAGVCGGLDPRLDAGHLVLPRAVMTPRGECLAVDAAAHAHLAARAADAADGVLVSVPAVVPTAGAKAELRARTGAIAADMESAAIVAAATRAGCAALVVRAVSDGAGEDVPADLLPVVSAEGRLRLTAALGLLGRPRALPRALALGRATRRALGTVARALACLPV